MSGSESHEYATTRLRLLAEGVPIVATQLNREYAVVEAADMLSMGIVLPSEYGPRTQRRTGRDCVCLRPTGEVQRVFPLGVVLSMYREACGTPTRRVREARSTSLHLVSTRGAVFGEEKSSWESLDILGDGEVNSIAELSTEHFKRTGRPLRVAIDEAGWRFHNLTDAQVAAIRAKEPRANPIEKAILWWVLGLMRMNIQPLFVFDGPSRPWKRGGVAGRIDWKKIDPLRKTLDVLKVVHHRAPAEAEAECALLNRLGIVDAVWSDDGDTLMFGATALIKEHREPGKGNKKSDSLVQVYRSEIIARDFNNDRQGLILFALLSGGDYDTKGLEGCEPRAALAAAQFDNGRLGRVLCETPLRELDHFTEYLRTLRLSARPSCQELPRAQGVDREQAYNLRALSKGWFQQMDEGKLRTFLLERFNFQTREYIRHILLVFLTRTFTNAPLDRVQTNLVFNVELVRKRGQDPNEAAVERKITFSPLRVTELNVEKQPVNEDWSVYVKKDGVAFDPAQPVEAEMLEYVLEAGLGDTELQRLKGIASQSKWRKRKAQDCEDDSVADDAAGTVSADSLRPGPKKLRTDDGQEKKPAAKKKRQSKKEKEKQLEAEAVAAAAAAAVVVPKFRLPAARPVGIGRFSVLRTNGGVPGVSLVQQVSLTPKNWASLCKQRVEGWFARNDAYSIDQLDGEIERLNQLRISYLTIATAMGMTVDAQNNVTAVDATKATYPLPAADATEPTKPSAADGTLQTAYQGTYTAQAVLAGAMKKAQAAGKTPADILEDDAVKTATTTLNTSRANLAAAVDTHRQAAADWTKWASSTMTDDTSKKAISGWMHQTLMTLQSNVSKLEQARTKKMASQPPGPTVIASATAGKGSGNDGVPDGTVAAVAGDENPNPVFGVGPNASGASTTPGAAGSDPNTLPQGGTASDPWTSIKCSFSAKDQSSTASTSSRGFSVGGGAGWGLWSVGGAYSHDQSSSDFSSDMSSCDVSVTFSALVVNIGRPWLYGELFADNELDVANGINLSRGPEMLKKWMIAQKAADADPMNFDGGAIANLSNYSMFPAYPTSSLVAADTTVEVCLLLLSPLHVLVVSADEPENSSAAIPNTSRNTSPSNPTAAPLRGLGPFSVSSSFHQASSKQSFRMQSTSTGCRLCFGAPQIIGWVSQILPALPRFDGYQPMVQNLGTWTA
ncbi:uncharacterized protein LTR77_010804 [Saxophila tyrrhenica]|uniref:XPG-I domain-containing protein n=1 Tax=Saxophila tyrrhenica TaxID=1690608 RepID=A0AAV9NUT2_9PEZI|nr:hypothetical protein LTR77_010804 [Saxophila tyrrhenica]